MSFATQESIAIAEPITRSSRSNTVDIIKGIAISLVTYAAVAMLSQTIEPTKVGDFFGGLGRASLGVFLIAAFVQGATREFLLRVAHTDEFWLQLLVPTVASTVIPAIIWYQQDRLRIRWLFS